MKILNSGRKHHLRVSNKNKDLINNEITNLKIKEEREQITKEELNNLRDKRKELNEIHQKEKIKWRQKSMVNWTKEGDQNTAYLDKIANNRRRQNLINLLKMRKN